MLESDKKDEWSNIIQRLDDYQNFLKNTLSANHLLTDHPKHLIYAEKREINAINIGIAGINTAWSCLGDGPNDKTEMWLGGKWQIKKLNKAIKDCDIKIGLSHHPFTWHIAKEESNIHTLQRYFDFHLHGHEHTIWVEHLELNHCRMSAGAIYERKGMRKESGYNIVRLDFEKNKGEIWLRRYDEKAGGYWGPYYIKGITDHHGMKEFKLDTLFPDKAGTLLVMPSAKSVSPPSKPPPELATRTDIVKISKVGGICEYYPQRINIIPEYWDKLYKGAEKKINLLGHSMAPTFSDDILKKWKEVALRKKDLKIGSIRSF